MTSRILVPTDGSDPASAALDHALDIAADRDAMVHLLYVADTNEPSLTRLGENVVDALELEGEEIISDAVERADDRGVSVNKHIIQGDPREVIVKSATDEFDLLVMGAHGRRGIGEYVLGSVTDYVVNRSDVPVLTVRMAEDTRRAYPYSDVLVPTDGSAHAAAAVDFGSNIAVRHGTRLHLLSVANEYPELADAESVQLPESAKENLRTILDDAEANARQAGVDDVITTVESGSVPRRITSYADAENIDLVVMGTHGHTGLDRHLLGSFTERVIRTSPVPVLTTRQTDDSG